MELLGFKGESKGIGFCPDKAAREATVTDPRDKPRGNCRAPQTTCLKCLPRRQMLLLEEYLPQLGIWVQRFPRKGEGWKHQAGPCLPF